MPTFAELMNVADIISVHAELGSNCILDDDIDGAQKEAATLTCYAEVLLRELRCLKRGIATLPKPTTVGLPQRQQLEAAGRL